MRGGALRLRVLTRAGYAKSLALICLAQGQLFSNYLAELPNAQAPKRTHKDLRFGDIREGRIEGRRPCADLRVAAGGFASARRDSRRRALAAALDMASRVLRREAQPVEVHVGDVQREPRPFGMSGEFGAGAGDLV